MFEGGMTVEKKGKKLLGLWVDPELHEQVSLYARLFGVSISDLLREILFKGLPEYAPKASEQLEQLRQQVEMSRR